MTDEIDRQDDRAETRSLMHQVGLGMEAEAFLTSNIGRYIVQRAEAERDEAYAAFKVADAEDARLIRELQARIYRAESLQYWLADLITEGRNAMAEIQAREQR